MAFSKENRLIFKYNNGSKMVGIDPLEVDIAYDAIKLDWLAKLSLARIGDADAIREVVSATRKIFSVPEYVIADDGTESGLSGLEVVNLFSEFKEWRTRIEGFTEPTPTLPPSTAEGQASIPTKSGTDSTSTSPDRLPETVSP
jgi:hypothetical protein